MNNLEIHLDGQDKDYAELVQRKIDVVSYLRLVDRLAECFGGGCEALKRAARIIYEHFLDTKPSVAGPKPSCFDEWIAEKENAELARKVTSGLSQVVQSCAKANQSCEYGFLDEGFVYDLKVMVLNDVAARTIECFLQQNQQ